MGKSRKDYEKFLNSISPDRDDEAWIIGGNGTLRWVDEERQEIDAKGLDCLDYVRELRVDDYLSPTTLEEIAEEIKKK